MVEKKIELLKGAVEKAKREIASTQIREALHAAVPTFYELDEINKKASAAEEMKQVAESD